MPERIMPTPDEARVGCCGEYRKPCTYHEGYGDGWEAAEQLGATADLDTPAPWEQMDCILQADNGRSTDV